MKVLLSFVLWCFHILPGWLARLLGRAVGLVLSVVGFKKDIIANQLSVSFGNEQTEEWLKSTQRQIYRHLGLLAVELLRLPCKSPEVIKKEVAIEGLEYLDQALAKEKGVLLLSGHIGNWEQVGAGLVTRGYTMNAVGKEMKSEAGEYIKYRLRDENGVISIPRRNSMKRIIQALRRNEIVVMMVDQNMTDDEGIFVDFFGQPACSTTSVGIIAERTGAVVVPACGYRSDDERTFRLVFQPALPVQTGSENRAEDLKVNTQVFTRCIEEMIRRNPSQWMWIHKRWKTRAPGLNESPFLYHPSIQSAG